LKRKKDNCIVTKRDDGTIIVEEKGDKKKKWIKFPDGT